MRWHWLRRPVVAVAFAVLLGTPSTHNVPIPVPRARTNVGKFPDSGSQNIEVHGLTLSLVEENAGGSGPTLWAFATTEKLLAVSPKLLAAMSEHHLILYGRPRGEVRQI